MDQSLPLIISAEKFDRCALVPQIFCLVPVRCGARAKPIFLVRCGAQTKNIFLVRTALVLAPHRCAPKISNPAFNRIDSILTSWKTKFRIASHFNFPGRFDSIIFFELKMGIIASIRIASGRNVPHAITVNRKIMFRTKNTTTNLARTIWIRAKRSTAATR